MTQTKAQHTPGPWTIVPVFISQSTERALHFGEYRFPHQVAVTNGIQHSKTYPREEAEANARLMEAAPDLLEAAKKVSRLSVDSPTFADAIYDLVMAVEKAEGR